MPSVPITKQLKSLFSKKKKKMGLPYLSNNFTSVYMYSKEIKTGYWNTCPPKFTVALFKIITNGNNLSVYQ